VAGIAAAIRTGRLPDDRAPKASELSDLPFIHRRSAFVFYGADKGNNAVYGLWCKADRKLVQRFFHVRCQLYGEEKWDLKPVDHIPNTAALKFFWHFWRAGAWFDLGCFHKTMMACYPHLLKSALEDS
jgi:hypothetical protein